MRVVGIKGEQLPKHIEKCLAFELELLVQFQCICSYNHCGLETRNAKQIAEGIAVLGRKLYCRATETKTA